jgi:hypothetical protein
MLTLLSTLLSFLMGGLPKLLEFFQDRADKKHELELARMQTERELQMLERGYVAQARLEEIKLDEIKVQTDAQKYAADTQIKGAVIDAQKAEMEALYKHDEAIGQGAAQWVINLRAGTRSLITMGFFLLLCFIDLGLIIYAFNHRVEFPVLADMLWDSNTAALFASIIAFHFGGRAFGK